MMWETKRDELLEKEVTAEDKEDSIAVEPEDALSAISEKREKKEKERKLLS